MATRGFEHVTLEQAKKMGAGWAVPTKGNKHHAQKVMIDGFMFASKHEGARYVELKLRLRAGQIVELDLQPAFDLWATSPEGPSIHVGTYHADFRYKDVATGRIVIEDAKSPSTAKGEAYRLRKKLAEACHGIEITEV